MTKVISLAGKPKYLIVPHTSEILGGSVLSELRFYRVGTDLPPENCNRSYIQEQGLDPEVSIRFGDLDKIGIIVEAMEKIKADHTKAVIHQKDDEWAELLAMERELEARRKTFYVKWGSVKPLL